MSSDPWILESKLDMPALPPLWLQRSWSFGHDGLPAALLLVAGPGFGKTLAMRGLLAAEAEGVTVWYSLDEHDADPATFFHYLVAGMRRFIPQFGEELLALLSGEKPDPRRLWQAFFRAAAAFNLPALRLVLDDAQALLAAGGAILEALGYFLERLPDRTHVLIASRQRLPFATAKLELKGLARVLTQADLRFSPAEEQAAMRLRAPGGRIPDGWRRQALEMDGWPLGIGQIGALQRQQMPRGGDADAGSLLKYVASEIVEAQSPDRQALMLRTALLQELTPEAIATVFELPDARERLAELESNQLVMRLGAARFRYASYLASYLKEEARHTFEPAVIASWHERAGRYFLERSQSELALPHQLACEAWESAIATCEACFPAMRFGGRPLQIERWLLAFPTAIRDGEPSLLLWQGHLAYLAGRVAEAQAFYERAQRGFEARDDGAGAFKALVRLCGLAFVRQDAKEANRLLLQSTARSADGHDEDLADLSLARALAADLHGDSELMRECNEAVLALAIAENVELAASHCNAHMNLYTLWLLQGELRLAERHIAQALALAERWHFYAYAQIAAFLRANLRLIEGDVEGAEALIGALPPVWEDVLDWHGRACADVVVGQLQQARGAWREAEEAFRRAMATFEAAGFHEGIKVPLERLLWLALQRRQYGRSEALLAEAGPLNDHSVYDLALLVPHGRALHLQGRHAEAEATLERALAALGTLGASLHRAQAQLFLAATRQARGDRAGAIALYQEAEQVLEARDYGFLRRQDLLLWEELGVLKPASPDPAVATSEADRGLQLRCLGGFEVHVDGVLVEQWPRKKAKLLLAALAMFPRGLTMIDLLSLVGEENVTPATINTWQVVLTSLRRALEPALAKRGTSRFILHLDDRYALDWQQVGFFDRAAFLEAATRGDALRDGDAVGAARAYEAAIGLYRGHLLEQDEGVPGFEADREYLKQTALGILAWLAEHHQSRAEEAAAERYLRRATELAPGEEDAYLALMRYALRWGRLELVRQVYWDCRKALKARLGLEPSREFEAAYRALAASA